MSNSTTGSSIPSSHDTRRPTKIYVDGFRIDEIDIPKVCDSIEEMALTTKVRDLLQEEGKVAQEIYAVPKVNPRFIMITTEM